MPAGISPSRVSRVRERLDGEVHHAVAADHDQRLDAVGDALVGEVEGLVGVAPDQVADDVPGVAQPRQHLLDGACTLPLARRWGW